MWYNVCRDLSQNVVKCCRMLWNVTQCIPPFLSLPFLQFLEKSTPPPKECNYDGYGWQEGTPLLGESWSLLIDAYFYLVTSGPRFGTHWFLPWRSWEVLYEVLGGHQEPEWEAVCLDYLKHQGNAMEFCTRNLEGSMATSTWTRWARQRADMC